ncbi:OLC1v1032966C1 [Oldenlandia corymbosa var. corymbosa]|uniref:OLC1v1032966C1 n=1 Tax=Oldenlandia corymbosa var. corymbosa TaxID=529605 RepID=A0AAV1CN16_OLDCO|nr:OLC1v1032966C1 [Oldenlandia corymbosa var. corymbosa]
MVSLISRTGRHLQRYNENGRRLVVGCIPYRFKEDDTNNGRAHHDQVEVLVISSQKGQEMMFPKGGWELDESIVEAASRESLEEAGVVGNVEQQLGIWRFKSKSLEIYHEGYMFPLFVTQQLELWPEHNVRKREWMTIAEAREVCKHWWMKEALDKLVTRLSSGEVEQEQTTSR